LNSEEREKPEAARESTQGAEPAEEGHGPPADPASPLDSSGDGDPAPETSSAEPEAPDVEVDERSTLLAELEATRQERDDYLDALRRLKAEFENARKRQERERARILETASENLVLGILPVLDNLDRALEVEGDIREGVRATRDQLTEVLGREGLLPVASDGQHFDPNVHEAVMGQPSDEHEEDTILQTFERGYLLNGKLLRPAKVVVAKQV
jgi:molecular chaperone GrpE